MERLETNQHQKNPPCIRVENLHYSYAKDVEALSGLSFTAEEHKITALLGPNGSGKSTTFKILSTQLTPQSGEAFVLENSVTKRTERVRDLIGVTFQSPSLDPLLSIEENLRIQAALYGLTSAEAKTRIEDLLKLFRIHDRRTARIKELSGGLARRAELAKTLLSGPRVLLLDEPTTGLDPLLRFEFWQELRKLRDSGMSIVVTTHLMEEADLCDEILIINKGKLATRGSPQALKSQLGNDILTVEAEHLERDEAKLREACAPHGKVTFTNGRMRVETRDTEIVFNRVREILGSRLLNLQMGKPTLADVYMNATGDSL